MHNISVNQNQNKHSIITLVSMIVSILHKHFGIASSSFLTHRLAQSIVVVPRRPSSPYDFTSYNPEYIPPVNKYHKNRKPRQAAWSDPNTLYPRLIPPVHKLGNPKLYLKSIQNEERERIQRQRDFLIPDIRSGDLVEITYQQTFENPAVVKYKGFVLGIKRRNSLMAQLRVVIRLSGVNILASYPMNSPKVKNIEIIARGTGNHKAHLDYLWTRNAFNKTFIQQPLQSGVAKKRAEDSRMSTIKGRPGSIKLDRIQDESFNKTQ